jgi:hypothetical protein
VRREEQTRITKHEADLRVCPQLGALGSLWRCPPPPRRLRDPFAGTLQMLVQRLGRNTATTHTQLRVSFTIWSYRTYWLGRRRRGGGWTEGFGVAFKQHCRLGGELNWIPPDRDAERVTEVGTARGPDCSRGRAGGND